MRGIIVVANDVLDDAALTRWVSHAQGYVAGLPPKYPPTRCLPAGPGTTGACIAGQPQARTKKDRFALPAA